MTLILAVPAERGIVLASDGQVTAGMTRREGKKIKQLNDRCLWSAAGELALIQKVEGAIGTPPGQQRLPHLCDHLAHSVKQSVTSLLQLDFRTQFAQSNPDALLSLHPGDFVFAEYDSEPRILHIAVNGTPEWVDGPFATGVGQDFAYALLQKYQRVSLNVEEASLLAHKVIGEAIEVVAYGLGSPIDVWQITEGGVTNLSEAEVAGLQDTTLALRDEEIGLLRQASSIHVTQEEPDQATPAKEEPAEEAAPPPAQDTAL